MVEYKTIEKRNFNDFLFLLKKRGALEDDFYRWKYIDNPVQIFPWGFIAYYDGVPCGCIGCLSKIFVDEMGNHQPATWFADWYVDPAYRGKHIGVTLQRKVLELSEYAFGITNPLAAQKTAQRAGYSTYPNCVISKGIVKLRINGNSKKVNNIKQYIKDIINNWTLREKKKLILITTEVKSGKEISVSFNEQNGHFFKDAHYFQWLIDMPCEFEKRWYLCKTEEVILLLRLDFEKGNIINMRVFHSSFVHSDCKNFLKYLRIIGSIAKKFNANEIESFDYIPKFKWNIRMRTICSIQPLQINSYLQKFNINQLSIADKESSWLHVEFKQTFY